MTREQFDRWKDFALRMVRTSRLRAADRAEAETFVLTILGDVEAEGLMERVVSWDQTDNSRLPKDHYGHTPIGPFVTDMVSELFTEVQMGLRGRTDTAWRRWENTGWRSIASCALRAGIDVASSPSCGVLGFTVRDIRRMYPEGIPDWLDGPWHLGKRRNVRLSRVKDDSLGVWL